MKLADAFDLVEDELDCDGAAYLFCAVKRDGTVLSSFISESDAASRIAAEVIPEVLSELPWRIGTEHAPH